MNKKLNMLFGILLITAFVLSACGGGAATEAPATEAPMTEAPATEAPATEAPTEAAPAAPDATLRVWADDTRARTGHRSGESGARGGACRAERRAR